MEHTAYDTAPADWLPAGRALVIARSAETARRLRSHLRRWGCPSDHAASDLDGLARVQRMRYAFVLLDAASQESGEASLCRRLRAARPLLPLVALGPALDVDARVRALTNGADAWLARPVHPDDLRACLGALFWRIRAERDAAARASADATSRLLRCGPLRVDLDKRCVTMNRRPVTLTPMEFDLLAMLAARPGRVYSRAELLESVWGYPHTGYSPTVNTHVSRLRKKIEPDQADPQYILTVWGAGYRMAEPDTFAAAA